MASKSVKIIVPAEKQNGNGGGTPAQANEVTEAMVDQFAYPVLTEEVTFPTPAQTPGGGGGGGAGTGTLARTVDAAMRDVLGGRSKIADPKGFTARLAQSFSLKYVEGHVEATWMPPNSVQVQADLGAITGAQASIYSRAKVALDQSMPLLDGLSSLRTDILPEDQEATRSIVRTELTQLVNELGVEGGPRVQRVDELFRYLLGVTYFPAGASPAVPSSDNLVSNQETGDKAVDSNQSWPTGTWPSNHVGELGLRFGMQRTRVNTIDDEQDLTNFIILFDYITGLWYTWIAQRGFFSRLPGGPQPFFGTQMVLLSRALAVVGESVQEVNFTMDSVFLGPAERQTLQLNFHHTPTFPLLFVPGVPSSEFPMATAPYYQPMSPPAHKRFLYHFQPHTSPLYVAELLDWTDRVASEEGPRLIQDAGKDGVVALSQTLDSLRTFVRGALMAPHGAQHPHAVPKGYATSRVQRSVRELADSLDAALQLAIQIQGLQIPNE